MSFAGKEGPLREAVQNGILRNLIRENPEMVKSFVNEELDSCRFGATSEAKKANLENIRLMTNYLGLAFITVFDNFLELGFAQILMIPLTYALFTREISNRTYSPSAYYLANWFSALCTYSIYPMITCLMVWNFIELKDNSFSNLMCYIGSSALIALCGLNFGILVSTFCDNPVVAMIIEVAMMFLFGMGGGQIVNIGGEDPAGFYWFNQTLMYLSPLRYGAELIMRCFLKNFQGSEQILNALHYNFGNTKCVIALLGYSVLYLALGWVVIARRSK
jgi:ABC-type transport system involved in multi-copper enzyme maturation permease subunit